MKRVAIIWMLCALGSGVAVSAQDQGSMPVSEIIKWQQPSRVLGLLSVRQGERVADLEAGAPLFLRSLASTVKEQGKLYIVESDPERLEALEKEAARSPYGNTVVVRGSEADPGLPAGELDLVLAVNTWHRVENRRAMRKAVQRALKPGGRLAIIDWHDGDIPVAPPIEQRLPHDKLVNEMKSAGWTVTTDSRMLEYQYLVILTPPAR